ncbi:HAMP domain-containing sensor histidine kinase [Rhodophyticola sp. MJ-SS7]|nr:HAMP domain-containing sensor histidine kinase [Rhodophyticola sp. MJ-SS7]
MAASIGGEIGVPFLEKLVGTLKDVMDAELVLITLGEGHPPTRARAIFAIEAGVAVENIEYDLDGTPCQQVYQGKTIVIPTDLADRFPKEEGLSGYVGVPIHDGRDHVIGHIAVFSKVPIRSPEAADAIVRIFGARVEAEQRHKQLADERDKLIAELVQTNETLQARNQALHDANQTKTALLGMVTHDLRNPLSAIVAQTELLQSLMGRQHADREKIEGRIARIMANADRLTGAIDATQTRCRSETGEIELRRRRVDVSILVATAIETNSREARRKSITLAFDGQANCWASLDDSLCLEAIDNLISNAIKYSQPGTEVRVSVRSDDTSSPFWSGIRGRACPTKT